MPINGTSYNSVAKVLHWLMAAAIIGMLFLGWTMGDADPSNRFMLYQLHKSVGITVLLLSLFRIVWRLLYKAPAMSTAVPVWQRAAAHSVHGLLYVLMLSLPMTGWAIVSSSPRNIPTVLFGVVPWPHLPLIPDADLSHGVGEVHEAMAAVLFFLLLAHIGAAVWHHFVVRDDTLLRMTPRFMGRFLVRIRSFF